MCGCIVVASASLRGFVNRDLDLMDRPPHLRMTRLEESLRVETAPSTQSENHHHMSQRSVFCVALSRGRADRIVNDLKEAKLASTEISVLLRDPSPTVEVVTTNDAITSESATGAESAGAIRGVMAWIAGIRRVVIPGVDPLIAAGPIADALSGSTVGGIAGGLIDFGVPDAEAGRYASRIKEGHSLISVHVENPDKCDRAREIFSAAGAEDICTMMNVSTPNLPLRNGYGIPRTVIA